MPSPPPSLKRHPPLSTFRHPSPHRQRRGAAPPYCFSDSPPPEQRGLKPIERPSPVLLSAVHGASGRSSQSVSPGRRIGPTSVGAGTSRCGGAKVVPLAVTPRRIGYRIRASDRTRCVTGLMATFGLPIYWYLVRTTDTIPIVPLSRVVLIRLKSPIEIRLSPACTFRCASYAVPFSQWSKYHLISRIR